MAVGFNALCGDKLTLYLKVEDSVICAAGFEGSGCAIATASASLLTESVIGLSEIEAVNLLEKVHGMVINGTKIDLAGKLEVLAGVHEFPQRVKCATLSWHTLKAALENVEVPVTTE